jgi:hypothetical protein
VTADDAATRSELLLIGGRSGVGKSSVGYELVHQLGSARIRHALIEGDTLDEAWPPPWEHHLAERNLAAMWTNYTGLGYRRLIYTNTASVRGDVIGTLVEALGDDPLVVGVLLTATDATARNRLGGREIGSALALQVERSNRAAVELDELAPPWVHRVPTDGRGVTEVALEVLGLTGWLSAAAE